MVVRVCRVCGRRRSLFFSFVVVAAVVVGDPAFFFCFFFHGEREHLSCFVTPGRHDNKHDRSCWRLGQSALATTGRHNKKPKYKKERGKILLGIAFFPYAALGECPFFWSAFFVGPPIAKVVKDANNKNKKGDARQGPARRRLFVSPSCCQRPHFFQLVEIKCRHLSTPNRLPPSGPKRGR
ncbi:hypothetical protein TW95_gp1384 [Pandoravirus inopinatum]|uniref:Uncharacterized protein n=1 Tax=Pandoravirus inopinatum TaxID=1605721 RepID=A0A0B5IZ14_9VIRU|nr:hypothetical protein TW95_gp1384 [Pandoravirus inopinatum]AJF98118.1 hypothetical protein [Pandoravirus inopinatum]